jgi:hypothetical protein
LVAKGCWLGGIRRGSASCVCACRTNDLNDHNHLDTTRSDNKQLILKTPTIRNPYQTFTDRRLNANIKMETTVHNNMTDSYSLLQSNCFQLSSRSSSPSSYHRDTPPTYHLEDPGLETDIRKIKQLFGPRPKVSSFAYKDDAIHARIVTLLRIDPVTDMSNSSRNGLANSIHFLIMRDMHDAVEAQRIMPYSIQLQYTTDTLEGLYCVRFVITEEGEVGGEEVIVVGKWVEDASEALESLRRVVERSVYGV